MNPLDEFLDRLYPPPHLFLTGTAIDNAIKERHLFIFGGQGEGKTATAIFLVEEAVRRYGLELVHAYRQVINASEDLSYILENVWLQKPIVIILIEDTTNIALRDEHLVPFFRIRDEMEKATCQREGLVLTIFSGHRFHDTPKSLRSDMDFMLFKSVPTDKWDRDFVKAIVGEEAITALEQSEKKRLAEPQRIGDTFIIHKHERLGLGVFPKPTATKDNFTPFYSPTIQQQITPTAKKKEDRQEFRIRLFW